MKSHELEVTGKKTRKRVGRGDASGHGTYAGRGDGGQNSRSGGSVRPGFEGGQNPLMKRLPKTRGFKKTRAPQHAIVHTNQLSGFPAGSRVDKPALQKQGIIENAEQPVKLLYRGDVQKKLNIYVDNASKNARAAVTDAGGTVTLGWQE